MAARQFSMTATALARKDPKVRPPLSKKALAAKARKRAAKARKNAYENEKMPLIDAVNVLRVRLHMPIHIHTLFTLLFSIGR
jgi:large subunit ribosomal protein L1